MKSFFKKIIVPIMTWQAVHFLGRSRAKIVAITGSVGKTSTKEAIYSFLATSFKVRKSDKSLNSEIGVPLAILGLKNAWTSPFSWILNIIKGFFVSIFSRNFPEILVLEIGADKPGDIKNIMSWLTPDIGVLTALAEVPVHVENFPSPESVYAEKEELIKKLDKNATAILNADDGRIMAMKSNTKAKIVTYGVNNTADISPKYISHSGISNIYPLLAGAAVTLTLGVSSEEILAISAKFETPPGRMKKIEGINGSIIIDDTYNSSPVALKFALNSLDKMKCSGRKIAALGDMLELGEFSESEHRKIGKIVAGIADMLVVVGQRARWIFEEAKKNRKESGRLTDFKICEDSLEAGRYLKNIIQEGDVILVKGSQGMRMEKLVEKIMAHPEDKEKLLVRQEKEWQKR